MDLTPELKTKIDAKSYKELLYHWWNAPIGDCIFQGESGTYWSKRMKELKARPSGESQHVADSKSIG